MFIPMPLQTFESVSEDRGKTRLEYTIRRLIVLAALLVITSLVPLPAAAAAPTRVADINPTGNDEVSGLVAFNGRLFFNANDGLNGLEPWRSNGLPTGTRMLRDINPS